MGILTMWSAATAAVVCVAGAAADVIIDNMGEPTQAITILGIKPPDNIWAAQAFTVPSVYRLESIAVFLGEQSLGNDPVVQLREGDGPDGTIVSTFGLPSLEPAGVAEIILIPEVPVTLQPGSTYWIVMGTQTTGSFGWAYAQGNEWKGPGTIGPYAYSEDQGATWGANGFDNPYHLRVLGSPVVPCPADFNHDGIVNSVDVGEFINAWFEDQVFGTLVTNWDGNGIINSTDVGEYINSWFEDIAAGCG